VSRTATRLRQRSRLRPPLAALEDELVQLRPLEVSDAEDVYQACQDPDTARWTTVPQPYRRADARGFIAETRRAWREGRDPTFAVIERASGRFSGAIGLRGEADGRWEVGYWTSPAARHKGLATAALRLISEWAFRELGARRIGLLVYVGNDASERAALKAGYQREGVLRRFAEQRGELRDVIVHSLLPEDTR
jgi:RimJ/RimL family protein N-acetyltransferase